MSHAMIAHISAEAAVGYETLIGLLVIAGLNAWQSWKIRQHRAEDVEWRVEQDRKGQDGAHKMQGIHDLVNSGMTEQLRLYATLCRRIAVMTGSSEDQKIADDAERNYRAHLDAQEIMDQNKARETMAFAAGVQAQRDQQRKQKGDNGTT